MLIFCKAFKKHCNFHGFKTSVSYKPFQNHENWFQEKKVISQYW